MKALMSPFLSDLKSRGLLKQTTDGLEEPDFSKMPAVYVGFDPTADSLHAGSLIPLLTMDRFRRRGGQVIVLLGGATGLIGDPSGKSDERLLQTESDVEERIGKLKAQVSAIFARTDGPAPIFVNNGDWYREMNVLMFLRDVGKHFSVNQMLTRDSVRKRLENPDSGISHTEFTYMLLQAYDFLHLFKKHGCRLQMGGSDQWGNIVSGTDLVRRCTGETVHGVTLELHTNSDGRPMGKTSGGAIWLDANQTSPYHFYQYWLNLGDADSLRLLHWLTDLSAAEIDVTAKEPSESRAPQRALAAAVTRRIHGEECLKIAQRITQVLFDESVEDLDDQLFRTMLKWGVAVSHSAGVALPVAKMLKRLRPKASNRELRDLVSNKSVRANGELVTNMNSDTREFLRGRGFVVVSIGRQERMLVRFDE